MCGEKRKTAPMNGSSVGSPPRVRGKVDSTVTELEQLRITPACAGKKGLAGSNGSVTEDHPRVCGEKIIKSVIGFRG